MKKTRNETVSPVLNILIVALIIGCFLCSMMVVRQFARENCFDRIEETTTQMSQMFTHALTENQNHLILFAEILAANSSNPDELLQTYMKNFCATQAFTSVCLHRANGTQVSYGQHPEVHGDQFSFQSELIRLPYISEVYFAGEQPEENSFYLAVPVIRGGDTVAILYGYISLDILPTFISSAAYDGSCQFYVVDGDTGNFLMDEYHGVLGNIYDGSMGSRKVMDGYSMEEMSDNIRNGESGYLVFLSQRTGEWYYTYYMPMGINNWSMQLTIDEPTAFASFDQVNKVVIALGVGVLLLLLSHVYLLMRQTARIKQKDSLRLQRSQYINAVQRALLNAHQDPAYLERALKVIADKAGAETVLLLMFDERLVTRAYYWPSVDRNQALNFLDRNIREDFPTIYDRLTENQSVIYPGTELLEFSAQERELMTAVEAANVIITPILDTAGHLRGAISAANLTDPELNAEVLECITYDLFMAITNVENHAIIQRMGAIDYLTNVKNRNSYEKELEGIKAAKGENLWCVFFDVNGLHEVNNTRGHKAGDLMLCTVAAAIKRVFGTQYTYRMGGDEFVAFAEDVSEEFMREQTKIITETLAAKGYFVSVGFAGKSQRGKDGFDVETIVEEAEAVMYRDKWEYYQRNKIPSERGHFPVIERGTP